MFVCLPLAAPIGLSPLHILSLCGPECVLVVSTEPPDDLSCLTTPGVGRPGDGAVARAVDQVHPDVHSEGGGGGLRSGMAGVVDAGGGGCWARERREFGGGGGLAEEPCRRPPSRVTCATDPPLPTPRPTGKRKPISVGPLDHRHRRGFRCSLALSCGKGAWPSEKWYWGARADVRWGRTQQHLGCLPMKK